MPEDLGPPILPPGPPATAKSDKIFINYRRDDSAGAGRVRDALEREFGPDRLFIDVDSIPLGANFMKILHEEVSKCGVLLTVIGPNWLDLRGEDGKPRLKNPNDFVRLEIAAALQRDIPVIPILLDGARIPKRDQLPKGLKELASRQGLHVRHAAFHDDMRRLIRSLGVAISGNAPFVARVILRVGASGASESLVNAGPETDAQPWPIVRDREGKPLKGQFRRKFEVAADPVFDLVVENTSGGPLHFLKTGIRILQRKLGTGGVGMGEPQPTKVQAEYSVHCREGWKRFNLNDNESWAVFQNPIWMNEDDSPFRFTLRLENFCDTDNSSFSEIRFLLQMSSGTVVESESIWLVQ